MSWQLRCSPLNAALYEIEKGMQNKVYELIELGWKLYVQKVADELLDPENEKMMQLQISLIFQSLASLFESSIDESIKVLLEVPVTVRDDKKNIIDIVIQHTNGSEISHYPIELKCFRKYTRDGSAKRGGGNLSMYDYWEDIENIELYSEYDNYESGVHLALTDDPYIVTTEHGGEQVKVYSTSISRGIVSGTLEKEIKTRLGKVVLRGQYDMSKWEKVGNFHAISHRANFV